MSEGRRDASDTGASGSLIARAWASVRRDRDLKAREKAAKAGAYLIALVSAPVVLRACDRVGRRARTRGAPLIENAGTIEIGDDVQLNSAFSPVHLATGPRGVLRVGDGVNVNFGTTIRAEESVVVGDRVNLAPYVSIADDDGGRRAPVTIGDDVWLATRVRVMPGANVGARTVVTAGSVVDGELPSDVVAGGVPARVLRRRGGVRPGVGADGGPEASVGSPAGSAPAAEAAAAAAAVDAGPPPARVLVAADFSAQELGAALDRDDVDPLGPRVRAQVAPFGQVVQTLHAVGASGAAEGAPDYAIVWTRAESAIPAFARRAAFESVRTDDILKEVDAWAALVAAAATKVRAVFVPTWQVPPAHRGLGMLEMGEEGLARTVMRMNVRLAERFERTNVYLLDSDRWSRAAGADPSSAKLWYLAKVGFPSSVFVEAAHDVRAALRALRGEAKKLVVLDLDDTMWGGIVGDVGWQNVRLGGHDGLGEAYVDLQRVLKALTRRGILLAIVSKNEESVALEAIGSHPEMVLKIEDVAAHRINWRDKAGNIVEIARELNLGLQSIVFLDDNPVERARVREALPEVLVPELPDDKMLYATVVRGLRCFDVPLITEEDRERTLLYSAERQRERLASTLSSIDEWLESLSLRVRLEPLDGSNLPRAAQLLNKTNQMNLRTRRLTEAELLAWSRQPANEVWTIHVSDRFGDAGLTGILSLSFDAGVATIADYVLSCRVMGRRIEETMVWAALERARARGATSVAAPYAPTPKNKPCLAFWQGTGFALRPDGLTFWRDVTESQAPPRAVAVEGLQATERHG